MSDPVTIGDVVTLGPRASAALERAATAEPTEEPSWTDYDTQMRIEAVAKAEDACLARFPIRYQDVLTEHPEVLAWVEEFTRDPGNARSLLLLGPTGTGKTYQAYGAVRAASTVPFAMRSGHWRTARWIATTYADLMASLRPRGRGYDTEEEMEKYRTTELLLIDDLGAGKPTEFTEEVTYRLINGRYEAMRPSIFTSNLNLGDLKDAIGDRIASRLAETSLRVVLDGPDRRRGPGAAQARPARRQPSLPPSPAAPSGLVPFWEA